MGGVVGKMIGKKKKIVGKSKIDEVSSSMWGLEDIINIEYDDDVHDAANLVIAIQNEDVRTNIEVSVSCENLPKMDFLG